MIKNCINSSFLSFRNNNLFVDIVFKTDNNLISAHRIFLSKLSPFFNSFFKKNSIPNATIELFLSFNPHNMFSEIISILYEGEYQITKKNCIDYYSLSFVYQFTDLHSSVEKWILEFLEEQPSFVFTLLNSFQDLCFIHTSSENSIQQIFSDLVISSFNKMKKQISIFLPALKKNYDQISTRIIKNCFSCYLLGEYVKYLGNISLSTKLSLIEKYYSQITPESNIILQEQNKQELSSIFQWDSKQPKEHNIYLLFLIQNKADWVPSKISRPFYEEILLNRQKTLNASYGSIMKEEKRWSIFQWLCQISESYGQEEKTEIEVISFLSTNGNLSSQQNICNTRIPMPLFSKPFLNQNHSSNFGKPSNLFLDNNDYFISKPMKDELPYIGIDFDYPCLHINSIEIEFPKDYKLNLIKNEKFKIPEESELYHYYAEKFKILISNDGKNFQEVNVSNITKSRSNLGSTILIQFETILPVSQSLMIQFKSLNSANINILRISRFKVYGIFVN